MHTFACRTRDASGSIVEKTVDADSRREALRILEECGLAPIEITDVLEEQQLPPRGRKETSRRPTSLNCKLSHKLLRAFTIQLGSSFKAGVPIPTALRSMAAQAEDARYRGALDHLVSAIEGGSTLSEAMRGLPRAFPRMYIGTVEAGERTGTLDEMLDDLAEYIEAEMEIRADVRSAVLYPSMVLGALFVGMSILVFFVVPRFAVFYSGFDAELPLPTRILVAMSEFVQAYGLWLAGGFVVSVLAAVRLLRRKSVRIRVDRFVLRIPFIGRLIETAATLQITRMLQLITRAGLPLLEGLETIAAAVRNTKSQGDLRSVAALVASGTTLAEGLESTRCLPADARQIISTGEETGSLNQACAVVSGQYRKELRYLTKNLSTFIEPVLTLFLAVVVLFVALAAFLPMWEMVRVVRG